MSNHVKLKAQTQQECKYPNPYAIEIQTIAESPWGRTKYGTMHVEICITVFHVCLIGHCHAVRHFPHFRTGFFVAGHLRCCHNRRRDLSRNKSNCLCRQYWCPQLCLNHFGKAWLQRTVAWLAPDSTFVLFGSRYIPSASNLTNLFQIVRIKQFI